MFLTLNDLKKWLAGFPRIRGDVPNTATTVTDLGEFSPHTRGCSPLFHRVTLWAGVFPAYAGMFRFPHPSTHATARFPRIRGDVPLPVPRLKSTSWFSPHTRGCSLVRVPGFVKRHVFPAYAGMFLSYPWIYASIRGFPRIRGDVPNQRRIHL